MRRITAFAFHLNKLPGYRKHTSQWDIFSAKLLKNIFRMSAIFLDRDGVVIRKAPDGEYVTDWCEVEFLQGSSEAIAAFCRFGYKVIIVTNQRGVATGKIELPKLKEIHAKMKDVINKCGGNVSGIYICPHDISEGCACRKPKAGMLLRAAADHQLRLSECWMVGDAETDVAAGALAAKRILGEERGMGRTGK
jgi:D-glycero-D-manno-heptose 1,7-bisphosphate phosphatase